MADIKDLVDEIGEAGVISSLIYNPELCYHSEDLTERHFSDPINSVMYYAITQLVKKGIFKIDAINILSIISEKPKLQKMYSNVTADTINEIITLGQSIARTSVEEYQVLANNIRDKAFRRKMYEKLKRCEKLCFQEEETCIQQQIVEGVNEVISDFSTMEDVKLLSEKVDDMFAEIQKAKERGAFLDFHIDELNKFCKLSKKETIVMSAPQKTGKSLWCMNITKTLLDNNEVVLYVDTEVTDEKFHMRFLAHLAQVEYSKIEQFNVTKEEFGRLQKANEYLKNKKLIHVEMPVIDDVRLINITNRMKDKYGVTALIVDYLKANGKYALDAYQNSAFLGRMVDTVHTLATKLDIYTFACAQASEDGNVAYSKNIARNCSTLLFMKHKTDKEIASDGGIKNGNMKIIVKDNRNGGEHGDTEYISVGFNGNCCTFYNVEQPKKDVPY